MPPPTEPRADQPAESRTDAPTDQPRRALVDLLGDGAVRVGAHAPSRDDAVRMAGRLLVDGGAVEESYIEAMVEREHSVSTFVGESVALPHATFAAEGSVHRDAIVVVTFAEPVDWDGDAVRVAVGLCAIGRGHIGILSRLASALLEPEAAAELASASDESAVRSILSRTRSS